MDENGERVLPVHWSDLTLLRAVDARRATEVGAVGVAEVALRRESGSCGDFLDAVPTLVDETLGFPHPQGERVFAETRPEHPLERRPEGGRRNADHLRKFGDGHEAVQVLV